MMTLDRDQERKDEELKKKPADAGKEPGKQALTDGLTGPTEQLDSGLDAPTTELVQTAQASPASGLPAEIKTQLEESIGEDLSAVKVHTGPESQKAASAMSANAFALGNDVHFAAGKFAPDTASGRGLIAHEVAHVVQSGGQSGPMDQLALSSPDDAHETEAHAFGAAFSSGTKAPKPQARSQGVGRAVISRSTGAEDPVGPPPVDAGAPTASGGASVKLSTKGVAIGVTGGAAKTLKGACIEATASVTVIGGGTLSWPEPKGVPSMETGGGATKGTDGKKSGAGEMGVEHEITLYEKQINEKAGTDEEQKDWLDGMEVKEVKLIPGASGGGGKSDGKQEVSASAGLKVEATLVNGTKIVGAVNIINVKADPVQIEGPNLAVTVSLPPLTKKWNLATGVDFAGHITGSATVSVKPDWAALAQEAGKLIMETSVVAALEMAATMAVILAPALAGASAISMIEDENALFHWTYKEAREARDAAISLWRGIQLGAPIGGSPRSATANAQGKAKAQEAMASKGLTQEEYILGWKENPFMENRMMEVHRAAQSAFTTAVRDRADAMYEASWSMKFWKSKADVMRKAVDDANRAWVQKA